MEEARWKELYLSALLETDKTEVCDKIEAAEAAMRKRSSQLSRRRDTDSILEVQAISAALDKLASRKSGISPAQAPKLTEQMDEGPASSGQSE